MDNVFGYCRVSAATEDLGIQLRAMREFGVPENNVFVDSMSGKAFDREAYTELVGNEDKKGKLQAGDLLVILSIDRLGNSFEEVLERWVYVTKSIKAYICVLDLPITDIEAMREHIIGELRAGFILRVFTHAAQMEYEIKLEQQRRGIEQAKAQGRYTGANHRGRARLSVDAELFEHTYGRWVRGEIGQEQAAQVLGLTRQVLGQRFRERKRIGPSYNPNWRQGVHQEED